MKLILMLSACALLYSCHSWNYMPTYTAQEINKSTLSKDKDIVDFVFRRQIYSRRPDILSLDGVHKLADGGMVFLYKDTSSLGGSYYMIFIRSIDSAPTVSGLFNEDGEQARQSYLVRAQSKGCVYYQVDKDSVEITDNGVKFSAIFQRNRAWSPNIYYKDGMCQFYFWSNSSGFEVELRHFADSLWNVFGGTR